MKVAAFALALALVAPAAAAAPRDARETLRPFSGAARERARHEVARDAAALRAAPASLSEREKDLRYRLPLAIALVHAGNLPSARHQWRSMLRRIPTAQASSIERTLPHLFEERAFANACPGIDLAANESAPLRRALSLARERDDAAARRSLAAFLASGAVDGSAAPCALLADATLAERGGRRGAARDRWFATLAVPIRSRESSLGFARYAALEGLIRTMP